MGRRSPKAVRVVGAMSLLDKLKAETPPKRATWLDSLTPEQRAEIESVKRAYVAGELPHSAVHVSRRIVDEFELKISSHTVRMWLTN